MAEVSKIQASNGTTYNIKDANVPHSSLAAESGGADLSLVTTGEKYTWNNAGGNNTWEGTQAQYDALPSHDPNTVYYITDGSPIDANLDDLADVSILSPADGDTLKYSNGSWVNSSAEVKQTETTTDNDYEILFSGTADNVTRTEGVRKSAKLTYDPFDEHLDLEGGILFKENGDITGRCTGRLIQLTNSLGNPAITLWGLDGTVNSDNIVFPHSYSTTEEKKVGYWIDGTTPIYEITYMDLSTITISANSLGDLVSWTTPIQPVSFKAYRYQKSGSSIFYTVWEHFGCQWQNNKLQAYNACGVARALNGFTVQYFKLPT
jgi:hypothetical protein